MTPGLILYDLLFVLVCTLLYGLSLLVGVEAAARLSLLIPWQFAIFPAAVASVLALIAAVSLASALCPRLQPGRYPLMRGAQFYAWLFRSLLRRVLFMAGLRPLILSSSVLRFLALRGLGARVAFSSSFSNDVDVLDPSLLTVERGATLGARALVAGHYIDKGELVLGAIHIGEGALISGDVMVGPDVHVGARARVQPRTSIAPGVRIGAEARIGVGSQLDGRAVVQQGERLPPRTHLRSP